MKIRLPQPSALFLSLAAIGLVGLTAFAFTSVSAADGDKAKAPNAAASSVRPALTVTLTQPQRVSLPIKVSANGNIAAWQEASVGTEANGLRLTKVLVNVGDVVKRGQALATFAPGTVQADVAQIRAAVAEAEAQLAEASANAQRARDLQLTGALSAQQINQYLTAEQTAKARLQAQRAAAQVQQLRLDQTRVLAPDDGIISSRSATVGAVLPAGQELFRLIAKGRLEWRAEVAATELGRVKPGMTVKLTAAVGESVTGKVRMVAPTVDPQTRNGIVYVDLGPSTQTRAGMFARGDVEVGTSDGLTLPQSAVLLRDGFSYVMRVGENARVTQTKVTVGRRVGEQVEILDGLDPAARVVATGGGFLTDGDTVRVAPSATPGTPKAASSSSAFTPATESGLAVLRDSLALRADARAALPQRGHLLAAAR